MAENMVKTRFRQKKDSAANWEQNDLLLLDGELALAVTNVGTTRMKVGDGTKKFSQLPFVDEPIYSALGEIPAWAKTPQKPSYTAAEVGAVPTSRTVNGKALGANISLTADDLSAAALVNGKVDPTQTSAPIVSVTANKTLALSDAGTLQQVNSTAARTVTIPTNASVAFPVGTEIEVMRYNTGTVTIAASTGVTLVSPDSVKTIGARYGAASLKKIGTNEWWLEGRLG